MSAAGIRITEIDVRVTDRCVARCVHCALSASADGREHLSVEIAQRFLEAVTERWGAPSHWCLSGGEPMLYPELVYELARLGRTRGIAPRLSTNGFWAESLDQAQSVVRTLREEGFEHVWISTDSFHAEFVPVQCVHILIEALREERIPFFVNLNYVFPAGEELGGLGLPQIRPRIIADVETLRIHQEVDKAAGDGAHGWCRVMDLGRGRQLIDSLGGAAKEARAVLERHREIIERPQVLELAANGNVIHRCEILGNVNGGEFPKILDQVS